MTTVSEIKKFKERTLALLTEPETADLPDDVWWERFGDLLDDVLKARAKAKMAARDARRCPATHNPGVWPYTARCVFAARHLEAPDTVGYHQDSRGRKWKDEDSE